MKKCDNCKICTDKNLAQIPYIEHQKRMHYAYKREKSLKVFLIGTNALWLVAAILSYIAR